ncbi:hypothetical protein ACQ4PT_000251 [Festuca glaucescens]
MARVRLPKHPATPSVSEDETEESASEDEVGEEELTLPVGAEAEVRNDDPGFVGSFYEVTVTGHRGRGYTVVYSTLVAEDGGPLEEAAAAADVRPRPPREERREFAVHEAVEALHNDGWWAGVVSAVLPQVAGTPRVYQVAFPTSRETMEFEASALRPHRVFQAGRWISAAQVQKEVIAAKSIEEARNTVSMSEDRKFWTSNFSCYKKHCNVLTSKTFEVAKLKDVFDDVELRYNVTAGHGMFSEINTANCVDPSTAPKDAGGSQHAVSQQGGGSTMDNRLSESLAIKHLPFVKTSPLWPHVETMEILHKAPQRPHLNQLRRFGPAIHEKMALESINRLDVKDDIAGLLEKMQVLSMLEANGSDVGALRSQLEALLRRKNMHHTEPHNDDDMMKTLEEKIAHKEAEDRELGARMRVLAMALNQLRLYASLVRDMVRSAVAQKMSNATEISRLKSTSKRARTRSEASTSALR